MFYGIVLRARQEPYANIEMALTLKGESYATGHCTFPKDHVECKPPCSELKPVCRGNQYRPGAISRPLGSDAELGDNRGQRQLNA